MSRILVTGATGFIGWHVTVALSDMGYQIWGLDHSLGPNTGWNWFSHMDILDIGRLAVEFQRVKPEAVIHLAAQPSLQASWKNAPHDANVNILGTLNLLGLCQRYKVKRFVFASTSAVYAPKTEMPYMETDPIGPQTPYGVSKAAAEYYIRISGLSYAILRLGNVYGPGQVPLGENQLIPRALAHIYQGEPFVINGDGEQRRDFVYVKDVARAFAKAAEHKTSGIYNIANGGLYSVNYIVSHLRDFANFKGTYRHGPEKPGELKNVCLSSRRVERALGWTTKTGIISGLEKTIKAWPKE